MAKRLSEIVEDRNLSALAEYILYNQEPLSAPFSPLEIPELQGYRDVGSTSPEIYPLHALQFIDDYETGTVSAQHLAGAFMQRLSNDPHALNWCAHGVLSSHHVAGSDDNLFELIRALSVQQKIALTAAHFNFWGLEDTSGIHVPHLVSCLETVIEFCRDPKASAFAWLPTNELLLQVPGDTNLCSKGDMGESAVLLESSPLNTLPKSLLLAYSKLLGSTAVERLVAKAQDLPVASQVWQNMIYRMGALIRDREDEQCDIESKIEWLALKASSGVLAWSDLKNHRWNSFYQSTYCDDTDVNTASLLLGLKNVLNQSSFSEVADAVALFYHVSDIDTGYAGGLSSIPSSLREFANACHPGGNGKLMFSGKDTDPLQVIEEYFDLHETLIASTFVSRSFSAHYAFPKPGADLLCIINHHDPGRQTDLYAYAIVRIKLAILAYLQEQRPDQDHKQKMEDIHVRLIDINVEIESPWPDNFELEGAYRKMPARLQSAEMRLSLGLPLSRRQLSKASDAQKDRSFSIELGL